MSIPVAPGRAIYSDTARARLLRGESRPLFLADWDDVVFIHYEVDATDLQSQVPFELDLRRGIAYVSLVAFTQRKLRPSWGGRLTAWLSAPLACHHFLNVRTYVRSGGEPGIYFLAEWLSSRLAVLLGPRLFGLPYRLGRHDYEHRADGSLRALVCSNELLRYRAEADLTIPLHPCLQESLDEFLMERYTAFTERGGRRRLFRIWHNPWQHRPINVHVDEHALLAATGTWNQHARLVGAAYSPGVKDVWIGRPQMVRTKKIHRFAPPPPPPLPTGEG